MRLIHIVPGLSEEASGPSYSVVRLCESLVAEKHQVTLAALDWAPLSKAPSFLKTFPLGLGPRRLGRSPLMYRWLCECCKAGDVDVLHTHGMWQMNAIYPAWAAKRGNVQLVYSARGALSEWAMRHGSIVKGIFWPMLQQPALRRATCFHATAESEYHDIRRLGFHQPVTIIPNGIDLPTLPDRLPSEQRTLLFLGRIHPKKGLDILLRAWRAVQNSFPNWRLVIAGSDDGYHGTSGYLDEIKAQAQQLGLKRLEFPGPLYGERKLQAYRNADLFVLPTYSENFGMTVAESLSLGTPAIVSKGAPWSGLDQENAGWWIEMALDPLIACLNDAMSRSAAELAVMGERGLSWMRREFCWEEIGARMAATYRWLCHKTLPVPAWFRLD
jgi:glycosyltransferase involved in cell wall biosynthesis